MSIDPVTQLGGLTQTKTSKYHQMVQIQIKKQKKRVVYPRYDVRTSTRCEGYDTRWYRAILIKLVSFFVRFYFDY
jgi:hypothetical protein